ncbi:protein kinase domain-containing protein [Pseudofrankia sp. BMG5.37]|uniref:protein kinase domain-containing protein n=1 Tax=Pseudofrankia sp. BMG5.37 TaxID=3050035 RepID=UPI002895E7DE|nr:protein kinase [Pseudofrankia sp. BMG5.37]MDT3442993.1 protein kinase [Pseudofrankia sp. BMG5.37]
MVRWPRRQKSEDGDEGAERRRAPAPPSPARPPGATVTWTTAPVAPAVTAPVTTAAAPTSAPRPSSPLAADAADVSTDWRVGERVLGLYHVRQVFTSGGMGLVYRVRHLGWNVDLAVKSPRPELFADGADQERFVREAETWVGLGVHPHLCACHYVRTLGGIPRVFAEYVDGGSLRDWIDHRSLYAGGPGEALRRILDLAVQTAWAVDYAHGRGVAHLDLKPANILLDSEGTAKVTDFGLARAHGAAGGRQPDRADPAVWKSHHYASPEQASGGQPGPPSDVWSFAVTVLEMFTGEVTWSAGPVAGAALADYRTRGPAGAGLPPMPSPLADLLSRCLRDEPGERPGSLAGIADEIAGIYQEETGEVYPRAVPRAVALRADELTNRALSMLDLDRADEAERLFGEALAADPEHLEATYNSGLFQWRSGRLPDDAFVASLEGARASAQDPRLARWLLAQVHLERDDADSARPLLEEAARDTPGDPEIPVLLERARAGGTTGRCLRAIDHADGVSALAVTAGPRPFVVSGDGKTVRVWDLATGDSLRALEGHSNPVSAVAVSADGRVVLSGQHATSVTYQTEFGPQSRREPAPIRVWDLATGTCLHTIDTEEDSWGIDSAAVSPDGRLGLTGGGGGMLQLWDLAAGTCLRTLPGHGGKVEAVAVTADGRLGLSGALDNEVRLWELRTGRCVRVFEGHTGAVDAVAASADGRFAVSGGMDYRLRVWELHTGRCMRVLEGHTGRVLSVAVSADGRFALSGAADRTLRLWELSSGRCRRTFAEHTGDVMAVALAADGHLAVSCAGDKSVRVWELPDLDSYACAFQPCRPRSHAELARHEAELDRLLSDAARPVEEGHFPTALALLRRIREIPEYERDPRVLDAWRRMALFSARTGVRGTWKARVLEGHTSGVQAVSLSPDGRLVVTGGDETIRVWELDTGRLVQTLTAPTSVEAVGLSPDGRLVVTGGGGNKVRVWELATGREVHTLRGHTGPANSVAVSPDGRFVVSAGDSTVRVWELATGRRVHVLRGGGERVESVAVAPDGRVAVSAGGGETVWVWDLVTGNCLRTIRVGERFSATVVSSALSPDGRLFVTGDAGATLRVLELATDQLLHPPRRGGARSVALSPDGRFALVGSDSSNGDPTARIRELATDRDIHTIQGPSGGMASLAMSLDGRYLVAGGEDGTVWIWETDWELEAVEPADWDDGAAPYLDAFLALHTSRPPDRPAWDEGDFDGLIRRLQHAGYGWLRPAGVRAELDRRAQDAELAASAASAADVTASGTEPAATPLGADEESGGQAAALEIEDEAQLAGVLAAVRQAIDDGRFPAARSLLSRARQVPGRAGDPRLLEAWRDLSRFSVRIGLRSAWQSRVLSGHTREVLAVAVSPDGRLAVSGSQDRSVRVWELATGRCLHTLAGHTNAVTAVAVSPDGRLALSGGDDAAVRVWELATGRLVRTLTGPTDRVRAVAVSPDGRSALSGGLDKEIRLWDLATGRLKRTVEGHAGTVTSIAISADGRLALSGSWDLTVGVWFIPDGFNVYPVSVLEDPDDFSDLRARVEEHMVQSVALTADGQFALTGHGLHHLGRKGAVRLWDMDEERCVRVLSGHTKAVLSVAVSPDGRFGFSGGDDGAVRVWELATGRVVHTARNQADSVASLALAPDGNSLLFAGDDGTLRVWDLDWDLEAREPADWDEDADLYLRAFLVRHGGDLMTSRASWTESDFDGLMRQLQHSGLGWLRPAGVQRELERRVRGAT